MNARLLAERQIGVGLWPGRELDVSFVTEGVEVSGRQRMFLVRNRLHQILAIGPTGTLEKSNVDEAFLASFRLTE
jgi:hypothetical protein